MRVTPERVGRTLQTLFVGCDGANLATAQQLRAQVHALRLLALGCDADVTVLEPINEAYARAGQLVERALRP